MTIRQASPEHYQVTGTIIINGASVVLTLPIDCSTVALQITGTWTGQIDFQGSVDGINYHPIEASNGTATVNVTAANDIFILPGAGYVLIRAIATAAITGAAVITMVASCGGAASIMTGALPAGTNLIGGVFLPGALITLLAPTTITTDATTNYTAVTGLDRYTRGGVVLTISAKGMDALTTLNIWIQRSLDGGTTWDDIGAFTQITSAVFGDGVYVMDLLLTGASVIDRVQVDGALAAHTVQTVGSWGDRWRVKKTSANFAGADTITIALKAYMMP